MRKEYGQFEASTVLEGMTSIRALLHARESGNNLRPVYQILYDESCRKKLSKDLSYLRAVADKHGYELLETDTDTIAQQATGNTHGGLIAVCGKRPLPTLHDSLQSIMPCGFYVYLDGIEDPYNFGYALRSLYACGVNGLILGERNWYSAAGVIARASAGASELLDVFVASSADAVSLFHTAGYKVVAADLRTEHELGSTALPYPLLLIAGGEKRGISSSLLAEADLVVKIPYAAPFRASLSAASAVTMFAYEIMRQNKK